MLNVFNYKLQLYSSHQESATPLRILSNEPTPRFRGRNQQKWTSFGRSPVALSQWPEFSISYGQSIGYSQLFLNYTRI